MDYRGFVAGATVHFPVFVPGALFHLGDGHAAQGDGEIVGTGIEISMDVQFTTRVMKRSSIRWPRGENAEYIFTIGNARPLDQAVQHATTEMLRWLKKDYGLDETSASLCLGKSSSTISQMCSTRPTRWFAGSHGNCWSRSGPACEAPIVPACSPANGVRCSARDRTDITPMSARTGTVTWTSASDARMCASGQPRASPAIRNAAVTPVIALSPPITRRPRMSLSTPPTPVRSDRVRCGSVRRGNKSTWGNH